MYVHVDKACKPFFLQTGSLYGEDKAGQKSTINTKLREPATERPVSYKLD